MSQHENAGATRALDVCLSPDLMHLYPVENRTVVVVDILRATSCMTTAMAHGVKSIAPFADLAACQAMKEQGLIIAAERNGQKVEGSSLGNSPFEYMNGRLKGKSIAFTTTNGTQAISKSKGAAEIVIGSFLNLSAVTRYLAKSRNDILVVCAGWKGKVNLEDTLFAGALIDKLGDTVKPACDAPLLALHLYQQGKDDLLHFIKNSSHVKRLQRLNIEKDIEFCLQQDEYEVVPVIVDGVVVCSL